MTQIKNNPTGQNINSDNNKENQNNVDTRNERSQEVELPTPEKKNDEITTGITGQKPEKNSNQTGQKPEVENDNSGIRPEKDETKKTGFDPENSSEPGKKVKDIDEPVRLNDTRKDSILDRPKTETYETNQGENVGGKIRKENYLHSTK